ncbi:MAG: porin [Colwellia sp.]|nr:porin [Colwellia sp.]MCW9079871.1 porin [Colwellia sp.]
MKTQLLVLTTILALIAFVPSANSLEVYKNEKTALNFSGNLAVYYLKNDDTQEVNDGFSRYVFDLSHNMKDDWRAVAKLEWGVQLSNTDNQIVVNHNGLTSTGPADETIWLRQGFVGFEHDDYGRFTLGKQWGVSYDIGGVTDWFEVFGADAQGTYNFGTDGGFSGSGRAEQAIQYRVNYKNFSFAAQYLASDEELGVSGENGKTYDAILNFTDSHGISILYKAPYDIGLGLAYNKTKLSIGVNGQSSDTVDDELISASITYRQHNDLGLHVALVYTDMTNHDYNDVGQVMREAKGIELFSEYRFDNDISLILGYISLEDNSDPDMIGADGTYHKKYTILSAKYHWDDDFYLFIESKIDDSQLSEFSSSLDEDATGIGMMFTF